MMWLLAICTGLLLLGISVMIILCVVQIFNEMVVEPIRAWRNRVPVHEKQGVA